MKKYRFLRIWGLGELDLRRAGNNQDAVGVWPRGSRGSSAAGRHSAASREAAGSGLAAARPGYRMGANQ